MNWSDFKSSFEQARQTMRQCDDITGDMARMIAGRLRKGNVPGSVLRELKKELQAYNMHTGTWGDKQ